MEVEQASLPIEEQAPLDPAEVRLVRAAYILSVFSGAAALIYQVTWVKMISLSLGSTSQAAGAVIGSFMAGMGIGARLYDVVHRRLRHPLRLYAGLEFGIVLTTIPLTLSLYSLPHLYAQLHGAVGGGWPLGVVRFVSVFLLLLVPSALMGATFPALCTALIRSSKGVGRHLGMIYGLNTLGAAAGSVAAGFLLIEMLGNRASTWVANGLNLLVAASALWLWTRVRHTELDEIPPAAETALESRLPRALVGAVLVGSGFATMAYEVFWIRALKYVVGNSTYAVSMVLVIFLVGLGIGGVLFRRIIQRRHPEHDLGLCQLAIAVLALGAVGLEALLLTREWFAVGVSIHSTTVVGYPWQVRLALAALVSVVLLLPPTIAMGLSFPLASRLYVEDVRRLGRGVGTAYLLANIGSILGVIIGATLLLPTFGTAGATKVVAGLNIVLGLIVLIYLRGWSGDRAIFALASVGGVAFLTFRLPAQIPFRGEFERADTSPLYWKEGDVGTVKVVEFAPGARAMTIDGYVIGIGGLDDILAFKQKLLAHFPMLLKPDARRTLNIGLGSGSTLATLAGYPDLELLDCVEIVPAVVEGADHFAEFGALDDSRVTVHVDDAVHFLLTSDTVYDIIIADGKQNPKFAGNAAILSEEFHRYCLDRLADDGVLIEWLSPTLHPRAFRAAVHSFCDVFPEAAAYYFVPSAVAIVGSKRPIGIDSAPWPRRFPLRQTRQDLEAFHITSPLFLMASRVADGPELRTLFADDEKNTWDHPLLEFIAYKQYRFDQSYAYVRHNLERLHEAEASQADRVSNWEEDARKYYESTRHLRHGYVELVKTRDPESIRPACRQALAANPHDTMSRWILRKIPRGIDALVQPGKIK